MPEKRHLLPALILLVLDATSGCTGSFEAGFVRVDASPDPVGATGGSAGASPTGGAASTPQGGSSGTDARPPASGDAAAPPPACASGSTPAAVQAVLATRCLLCHGAQPIAGVPSSLATYDAFMRPSKSDPSRTVGDVSRARITATVLTLRMPPAPADPLPAAELQTLQSWFDAGMPAADCANGGAPPAPAPDPFAVPAKCTSGTMWTRGNNGSGQMQPGEACIACHSTGEGPRFAFGGTLYPSGHEPSQCDGLDGTRTAAQVVVVDAAGRSFTANVNAAGNFYSAGRITVTPPLHAKVVYMGRERVMASAVTSGDCNACHTQGGAMGAGVLKAPGRVLLP
jgi:hypothetical protein